MKEQRNREAPRRAGTTTGGGARRRPYTARERARLGGELVEEKGEILPARGIEPRLTGDDESTAAAELGPAAKVEGEMGS